MRINKKNMRNYLEKSKKKKMLQKNQIKSKEYNEYFVCYQRNKLRVLTYWHSLSEMYCSYNIIIVNKCQSPVGKDNRC